MCHPGEVSGAVEFSGETHKLLRATLFGFDVEFDVSISFKIVDFNFNVLLI